MNFNEQSRTIMTGSKSTVSSRFMTNVYLWMSAGLGMTAAVSFFVSTSPSALRFMFAGSAVPFFVLALCELGIVFYLSSHAMTMRPEHAGLAFFVYASLNGVTLSPLMIVYTGESLTAAFLTCAGMFAVTAVYGITTKRDLSGLGSFCMMGVFGLIIAGLINMFVKSLKGDLVISIMGVIIFAALSAWDAYKIRAIAASQGTGENEQGLTVLCALSVYLDFVNMFIYLVRIMGKRRR